MEVKEIFSKLKQKFKENLKDNVTGDNVDAFVDSLKIFEKTEKEILGELCVD